MVYDLNEEYSVTTSYGPAMRVSWLGNNWLEAVWSQLTKDEELVRLILIPFITDNSLHYSHVFNHCDPITAKSQPLPCAPLQPCLYTTAMRPITATSLYQSCAPLQPRLYTTAIGQNHWHKEYSFRYGYFCCMLWLWMYFEPIVVNLLHAMTLAFWTHCCSFVACYESGCILNALLFICCMLWLWMHFERIVVHLLHAMTLDAFWTHCCSFVACYDSEYILKKQNDVFCLT